MSTKRVLVPTLAADAPQILRVSQVPIQIRAQQAPGGGGAAVYSSGTLTNGYGPMSVAGITVQIGTSGVLDFDFTVDAISYESFQEWHTKARQTYSSFDWHHLDEHYDGSAEAGGFFGGLFGSVYAGGQFNHYKNSSDGFQSDASQQSDGLAQSVYNLTNSHLHVSGHLTATGVSFIPVTVYGFLQLTKIVFSDSKTLYAIDAKNPVAATNAGDTSGATSTPTTLNIVTS